MSQQNFIDYVKIHCKSGNGGPGSSHMRREKYIPNGGPDGGDGGNGGSIILKGNAQLWTLLHLKYKKHFKAENGRSGTKQRSTGASGKDIIIEVPLGTIAKDAETGEELFEITADGETRTLLYGGKGGLGNWNFKSSTNQAPTYSQPGLEGSEGWRILELKVLADVGLVGFPNAGKSTLLSAISAAKPKIANYAFTTLKPNLGIVGYRDHQSFVMADIPGIIEGASQGKGLGLRFLRHIERNSCLLFIVSAESESIVEQYNILIEEISKYNPELLVKDRILAVSKSDLLDEELEDMIKQEVKTNLADDLPVVFFSSVSGYNIDLLKDEMWKMLQK